MQIEYEATFTDINKDDIRKKLKDAGAVLVKPEFLQKRVTFRFPEGHERKIILNGEEKKSGWIRARDENDKITMTIKMVDGEKIDDQKEITLNVDDFSEAIEFIETLGCKRKSYQETKRELWTLDNVEITIDEWPYLEPFVEIEGESEEVVRKVSEKLGFDYSQAFFGCVSPLYARKYNVPERVINNETPLITFHDPNPFTSTNV